MQLPPDLQKKFEAYAVPLPQHKRQPASSFRTAAKPKTDLHASPAFPAAEPQFKTPQVQPASKPKYELAKKD